jgi:hypothetical protein
MSNTNVISVETWNDFLQMMKTYKEKHKGKNIWFRGQGNSENTLLPCLLRAPKGITVEKEIFEKYRQMIYRIKPQQKGEWETLFDMQRNYIPTRLLDWSENLGFSVYFAVKYNDGKSDMAIYLLDPYELNKYSSKDSILVIPDNQNELDYIKNYLNKNPVSPQFPIAVRPDFSNSEKEVRRWLFTIHGDDLTPIEQLCSDAVLKVILSKDMIEGAIDFLEFVNINEYTVFPDITGISDYLRQIVYS